VASTYLLVLIILQESEADSQISIGLKITYTFKHTHNCVAFEIVTHTFKSIS